MIDAFYATCLGLSNNWWWTAIGWPVIWALVKIVALLVPVLVLVAYATLWERKLLGWIQVRNGPNRVGPWGIFQPFADALKLLTKEIINPTNVNFGIFRLSPVLAITPALAAWAVVPVGPGWTIADVNAGILLVMAITSVEVYGVVMGGWSSNSKYPLIGGLRASAQMISYELAIGTCFLAVILVTGSLKLGDIVNAQAQGYFVSLGVNFLSWNWLPLLPLFFIYMISGVAETNRHPFDVVEGEAEIVAGHMVEYSGMGFAIYFLAEYACMWLISILTALMFLGGWEAPLAVLNFIPGWIWLWLKTCFGLSMFIWIRGTFPRYRYDQIMRLGWKIFLPLSFFWLVVIAVWMQTSWNIWIHEV